jgi:hypothetical protein
MWQACVLFIHLALPISCMVAPAIAEEDVAGVLHRPVPPKWLIDQMR